MGKRTRARKRQFAVAFLAPAMALYTGFMVLPIGASLFYSLTDWRIGRDVSFVGLRNYIDLFQDEQYWAVAGNSFLLIALAIFVQVPLALVVAYCVHWVGQGFRFYRSVMFLPVVIAPVAIGLAFSIFLNGDIGLFNELLRIVGLEELRRNWLADSDVVLWAVSVPNIWHHIGLFIIIFVAAIRGIPEEIFEAAALDGASRLAMLPMIAIPILREVIVINIILAATIAIRAFDHSWIMTQGGPGQASSYFATLIYKRGFLDGQFAYASAIAVTLLVYVLMIVFVARRLLLRGAR